MLDFSGLNYIDSLGIDVLAICTGLMERVGGKQAIVGASGQGKRLLVLTHLDRPMGIYPGLPSARTVLA